MLTECILALYKTGATGVLHKRMDGWMLQGTTTAPQLANHRFHFHKALFALYYCLFCEEETGPQTVHRCLAIGPPSKVLNPPIQ